MFTLLNELHFWTFRSEIAIRDTDFGAFCYYEKRSSSDNEGLAGKKSYSQERGILWNPSNKRPAKLRHSITQLEEYLESSSVIYSHWKEPDCLLVILTSGLLISLKINILTGDLEHIHFDKHLLTKLLPEQVSDVAVGGSEAIFGLKGNKVLAVHYAKSALKSSSKHWVTIDTRSSDLVASTQHSPSLRLRISSNSSSDKLAVWWERDGDPWQQASTGNFPPIHIYHFSNLKPEPACCLRSEAQPILVTFSGFRPSILHIVVQIISPRGEMWLGWCQMDISCLRGDRGTAVQPHRTIPVQSRALTVSLSPAEDKLLIACTNSTLMVADYSYDCVVTNKTTFENSVAVVAWHPDSCIIVAADQRANVQFFDSSLSPIRSQFTTDQHSPLLHLDIGNYFKHQPTLVNISWNKKPNVCNSTLQLDAFLFLHFESGPLGVLKLLGGSRPGYPVDSVVCQYLSDGSVDRAISLLSTLAWDSAGSAALASLQSIVNYLLVKPLTPQRHSLLEKAVGSYFDSKRSISRVTCVEFNDSVTDIRRKIFHHLLRYQVYESALKLAVDLGHYDLLMDVHSQAKHSGLNQLAITALEKAEQISEYSTSHSRSSVSSHSSYESSCSWCSRSSCSQCRDEEDPDKTVKQNTKDQHKNNSAQKYNGKSSKTNSKPVQDENSSQASSKTSLLPANEPQRRVKGKLVDILVNSGKAKSLVEPKASTEEVETNPMISQIIPCTDKADDENRKTEHNSEQEPLNDINMKLENCLKIEMCDQLELPDIYGMSLNPERSKNHSDDPYVNQRIDNHGQNSDNGSGVALRWSDPQTETSGVNGVSNHSIELDLCKSEPSPGRINKVSWKNGEDVYKFNQNSNKPQLDSQMNNVGNDDYSLKWDRNMEQHQTNGENHIYGMNTKDDDEIYGIGCSNSSKANASSYSAGEIDCSNTVDTNDYRSYQKNTVGNNYMAVGDQQEDIYGTSQNIMDKSSFKNNKNDQDVMYGNNGTSEETGENSLYDIYSNQTRNLDGRISAEYDRDCLADVENGMRGEFNQTSDLTQSFVNGGDFRRLDEPVYKESHSQAANGVTSSELFRGYNSSNGIGLPVEPNHKTLRRNFPRPQAGGEMPRSSLWGKDRVHVQNVVGDQWFGSLVRVSKSLRTAPTSQNVYTESRDVPRENDWSEYQTYPHYRKQAVEPSTSNDTVEYQLPSTRRSAHYNSHQAMYNNTQNHWPPPDPRLNQNMCDLQKESFINEDTRRLRRDDKIPNVVHHNWMEPHSGKETRGWRTSNPSAPLPWSPPLSSFQNKMENNQWDGNRFERDNLYERVSSNSTRWEDNRNPNHYMTSERLRCEWRDSDRHRELSPARVGPNLWIGPQDGVEGGGVFWPKPYLGPRDRPPPPPPPRPTKVQFSDSVTHIPVPHMEDVGETVEGNMNTVGLPDAGYVTLQRRQVPANQVPLDSESPPPLPPPPSSEAIQGNANNAEETSKVKVVHFGLV